jgi:hypothetical protein
MEAVTNVSMATSMVAFIESACALLSAVVSAALISRYNPARNLTQLHFACGPRTYDTVPRLWVVPWQKLDCAGENRSELDVLSRVVSAFRLVPP